MQLAMNIGIKLSGTTGGTEEDLESEPTQWKLDGEGNQILDGEGNPIAVAT